MTSSPGATAFDAAFGAAARWLLLSGTPFRSDAAPIPGVRYDSDGIAVPDVTYSYADAVRDGVCRPVTFVPYDGVLQWQSGDETIESSFATSVHSREAARRYRTAIRIELPDGLPRILAAAHAKLLEIRAGGHRDAGGLVVAADGEHARAVAEGAARGHRQGAGWSCSTPRRARPEARGVPRRARAVDRRGEHGLRGRRHPAAARRRLRDRGQDAADLPPDRRAVRAHDPGRAGST